ncbi:MAG TPA: carbohydrate kinase family protein [Patescibacteria group bacterium]|nr:carbohydrate kinase family protein [Patescibacteria group bacterium]
MNSSFDAVTIGNSTIDIFFPITDSNDHFRFNKDNKEICIHLGDKTVVDHVKLTLGGNAANVGVGLSKLGFKTAVFSEIGKDEFATKILNDLEKENIDCSYIKQTESTISVISIILTYKKERTIISEDAQREHDFDFSNLNTKWVYLTALGKKWEEAYEKTLEFTKNSKAKLAFNPGTRQLDAGYEKIKTILEETEILIVNKEEAKKILSREEEEIRNLLKDLKTLGPKVVVITDGLNGSFALDYDNKYFENRNVENDSVERTGAGDAYSSGFLSAYMLDLGVLKAMQWGTLNASATVKNIGGAVGLLTREEIEKLN